MSNLKKYNLFVFISTFARGLIEIFIPLILYDKGFSIKEIILFLLYKNTFCLLAIPISKLIGDRLGYVKLMIISVIFFIGSYVYINFNISLVLLSILFAFYNVFYYIGRHSYAISIIEDKKATDNVCLYQIFTILGSIISTYIGAKVISKINYLVLSVIVSFLIILSIIPLFKIRCINSKKDNIKNIVKTFPIKNYLFTFFDQARYIIIFLFPLYIYLFVRKKFTYLGTVNFVCYLGSIIYIYFLSRVMDKNKKNYLLLTSLLLSILLILKLVFKKNIVFLIITFFEGIFKIAMETIVTRNTYVYGKNYDSSLYVIFIEFISCLGRCIFLLMFYLFNMSLISVIVVGVISIIISGVINYDDGKYGYSVISS